MGKGTLTNTKQRLGGNLAQEVLSKVAILLSDGGERKMEAQMKDWRLLSEAASREQDPEKLIRLVEELNRVLTQHEVLKRRRLATN